MKWQESSLVLVAVKLLAQNNRRHFSQLFFHSYERTREINGKSTIRKVHKTRSSVLVTFFMKKYQILLNVFYFSSY